MRKFITVDTDWCDLCERLEYFFRPSKDENEIQSRMVRIPTKRYGTIVAFHSKYDGSPNWKMINLFFRLKKKGLADRFLCCDPDKLPPNIRPYHIMPEARGEIGSDTKLSHSMGDTSLWVIKTIAEKRSR